MKKFENMTLREICDSFSKQINEISQRRTNLMQELSSLVAEENKLKKALDGILPLVNGDNKQPELQSNSVSDIQTISWRSKSLEILKSNPGTEYTSPEIFDLIYPNAKELDHEKRRKAMINQSLALAALLEKKLIKSKKNENGRGKIYYAE